MNGTVHALKPTVKGAQVILETIIPATAKKWLETMVNNRALSQSKHIEYAIAMDEGRWVVNGENDQVRCAGKDV